MSKRGKKEYKDTLFEVIDRIREQKSDRKAILMDDWQRLVGWHHSLMKKVYKQPTRDADGLTDRVLFFLQFVKENKNTPTWLMVKLWTMVYARVETVFNLRKYNIAVDLDKPVAKLLESKEIKQYSELLVILFRYKPMTTYQWMAGFIELRREKGLRRGRLAQENFIKRVVKWKLAKIRQEKLEGVYIEDDGLAG